MTTPSASAKAQGVGVRIGIVRWADPTGKDPAVYYGLRIDGAYVRSNGQPVGYRSAAEARRAKETYRRYLTASSDVSQ